VSTWTPSIVSRDDNQTVYLVMDDLGRLGRSGARRTPRRWTSRPSSRICWCQYGNPVRVVAFNTAEGWTRDVSEDVAHELQRRSDLQPELPVCPARHEGSDRKR
jgi:hypothetical protein